MNEESGWRGPFKRALVNAIIRTGSRNVARLVRDACRRVRAALADDPYDDSDKHRCPVCYNLDADEANGILRIDFDIWESEPTHDPRV